LDLFFFRDFMEQTTTHNLTGSQGTGSYIFATELSRLWASSQKTNKSELVIRQEITEANRLTQLSNNSISLAIIDAKSAHEELKKHSGLRVLSVLWKNWLYVLGTVPGPFLSLESTQTLLVHDNSLYFAQVWKKLAPQSKINWFNSSSIPDFTMVFLKKFWQLQVQFLCRKSITGLSNLRASVF